MAVTPRFTRRNNFSTIIESTKGVDPGSGYSKLLPQPGVASGMTMNRITRDTLSEEFGTFGGVNSSKLFNPTGTFYLKGGGASDPTPDLDPLIQASSMSVETTIAVPIDTVVGTFTLGENLRNTDQTNAKVGKIIWIESGWIIVARDGGANTPADNEALDGEDSGATAATNGTPPACTLYQPVSTFSEQKTVTVYNEMDGIRKISKYTMGNNQLTFPIDGLPTLAFTGQGIYAAPTDSAALVGSASSEIPLPCKGNAFTLHDLDTSNVTLYDASLDFGSTVAPIKDAQAADAIHGIQISNQAPTGNIEILAPLLSVFDPYTLASANTQFKWLYKHGGSAAGKRIWTGGNYAEISGDIGDGEQDGLATYTLPIEFAKDPNGAVPKFFIAVF